MFCFSFDLHKKKKRNNNKRHRNACTHTKTNRLKLNNRRTEDLCIMLVVEHHNIGQVLVHRMVQVHLMHFRTLVVVFVDSVVDNPFVVAVDKQQLNHAEVLVLVHLLLHMDHRDNLNKHHNHCKMNRFI